MTKYNKLAKELMSQIQKKKLGDKLPSISSLRKQYNISRSTVDSALDFLESQGIVERKPRRGIFISSKNPLRAGSDSNFAGGVVDIILPGWDEVLFAKTIRGAHCVLEQAGYRLQLTVTSNSPQDELKMLKRSRIEPTAGVIFMPCWQDDGNANALSELMSAKPLVQIDRHCTDVETDFVAVDSYGGSKEAVRYLVENGHRRIGMVHHSFLNTSAQIDRYRGYLDGLMEAGIKPLKGWEIGVATDRSVSGYEYRRVLTADDAPTAFVLQDNTLAKGFIDGAESLGLVVPDDISLMGFDDPDVARDVIPQLTHISQPTEEVAARAAELLIDRIENRLGGGAQRVLLNGHLSIGQSIRICQELTGKKNRAERNLSTSKNTKVAGCKDMLHAGNA